MDWSGGHFHLSDHRAERPTIHIKVEPLSSRSPTGTHLKAPQLHLACGPQLPTRLPHCCHNHLRRTLSDTHRRAHFDGIKQGRVRLPNFYPEWADPSYGLCKILIIVLTAVIIFPYLPGSSSPAFQGISIFIGLLVSLGSTTAVANVVAGTVLTYTRAFKVGDQVLVSTTRGRIVERTTFVTRVQTPKNVIVSIPNSMVLNNDIINYSQNMGKSGLLVHTSITIGYDVPWETVNKLLIAAANKTERIETSPEPFVLQTSLDDNYVNYEINGWTQKPEELPVIYSKLHANILDEFHGHNVEITSPAYRASRDGNASTIPEQET